MSKDKLKTTFWQKLWSSKGRWGYLAGGLVALGLLVPLYQLYMIDRSNPAVVAGMLALSAGGIYLLIRGLKAARSSKAVITGLKAPEGPANSLNIYVMKDEETGRIIPQKVVFELVKEPLGQPWECLDDHNWYYLHYFDLGTNKLRAFNLPDSQFFDPQEFASVITMPAHKKLFTQRQTLFQKIGPWVMLIAFGLSMLGVIMAIG